jgi:hypothetical protein
MYLEQSYQNCTVEEVTSMGQLNVRGTPLTGVLTVLLKQPFRERACVPANRHGGSVVDLDPFQSSTRSC